MARTKEKQPRALWTPAQLNVVTRLYANTPTVKLAAQIHRTTRSVYQKALQLGLKKSAEYMRIEAIGRLNRIRGGKTRFKKGHRAWNTGMKGLDIGGKESRFKPGHKPKSWKPVGTERIEKDGYLVRKVSDTGVKRVDWRLVHVWLWEQHNGPLPVGRAIGFKDRNKQNIVVENLECVSRADLMNRNTVHNLPKQLAQVCQLRGALNRQINRRMGK